MAYGKNLSMKSNTSKEWNGKRPWFGAGGSKNAGIDKFYRRLTSKIERKECIKEINDIIKKWQQEIKG